MGRQQHRIHGSPERFQVVADFIADNYGNRIKHIADVAGGQGLLSRILNKKYNYESEVVDPRGWTLRGVGSRQEVFDSSMAPYYDLIIGLHPDEATRAVAEAALIRPVLLVPCCNFWSEEVLGTSELIEAIEMFYRNLSIPFERFKFDFKGPKNIGLVSEPPNTNGFK